MTLSELGAKHGTDKGTVHSYLDLYEELFSPFKDEPISLLEIGVEKGNSLKMWFEYFPKADIHGLDQKISLIYNLSHRSRVYFSEADQANERALKIYYPNDNQFDIIIDDGGHDPATQILSFHYLWRTLKRGGLYCIEDLINDDIIKYWQGMPNVTVYPFHKDGRADDILVVIRKL
jgi:hypothetical protein